MSHPLLARLRSPDPDERRAACEALTRDPAAPLLVDALGEVLGDREKKVARAASDALVAIARASGGVETPLRRALRGESRTGRFWAAFTWARIEPPSPRLLPALVEALSHPEGDVRWSAARLLVETGRLHGEVLRLLLGLARGSESPAARRMATYALRELAPDLPEATSALLAASRDEDAHVRRAALTAMAALLDPPSEVAARLAEARDDPDPTARRIAERALALLQAEPGGSPG